MATLKFNVEGVTAATYDLLENHFTGNKNFKMVFIKNELKNENEMRPNKMIKQRAHAKQTKIRPVFTTPVTIPT